MSTGQADRGYSLTEVSFPQITIICIKLAKTTQHTSISNFVLALVTQNMVRYVQYISKVC